MIVGIYQFLKGASLGVYFLGESHIVNGMIGSSYIDIGGNAYLRAYGTFAHPNILAGWLFLIFIFSLLRYEKEKKFINLLICLLAVLLTLLTFSRITILLLLLGCTIYLLNKLLKNKLYSFSSILFIRFLNIFTDSSWSDRVALYKSYWNILKENFFIGTGMGNSIRYLSSSPPTTSEGRLLLQPVHNIFMLSITELGIINGVLFFFLQYIWFIKGVKFNLFRVFILFSIVLIGVFDHYFFSLPQGNIILFSLLALLSY
jgi:O-antigen ligase